MGARRAEQLRRFEEACHSHGLPVTSQRRLVFEVLLGRKDHPTADELFDAVRARSDQVSRRTVYRVLDTLAQLGLIRRVHHPGAAVRYDAKTHRHHHLVCRRCNRIVDVESAQLDCIALPRGPWHGFAVSDFSVQLIGLCPRCRRIERPTPDSGALP